MIQDLIPLALAVDGLYTGAVAIYFLMRGLLIESTTQHRQTSWPGAGASIIIEHYI